MDSTDISYERTKFGNWRLSAMSRNGYLISRLYIGNYTKQEATEMFLAKFGN
jgi:hypothetical protein